MNSSAALKAFCGRHGGIVCTSSNASTVLEWAFERGQRVLFFPDQHLGRNTAKAMGIPMEQMPTWNPRKPLGGHSPEVIRDAKVLLWHGFCSVHKRFTVAQVKKAREDHPGVKVIVHPEAPMPVVDAADAFGSTDKIRRFVAASEPGDVIAIGTEINMVNRLAAEYPDRTVFCLDPVVCPCSTMYRIHPGYLAWVMDGLVEGEVRNEIVVDDDVARDAKIALERMLAALPRPEREPDVRTFIVVGSGVAGLTAALEAVDAGHDVTLLTKSDLAQSNTRYAQGGVAVVMTSDDTVAEHVQDTLIAGAGLSDEDAVEVLCSEGPAAIREMIERGVQFDRVGGGAGPLGGDEQSGELAHGLEAAHSHARILHAGGDATGAGIAYALIDRLRESTAVVRERTTVVDLVVEDGRCVGSSAARRLRAAR